MQRIEVIQNRVDLSDELKKDQISQAMVARRAVMAAFSEVDREIGLRRAAAKEKASDASDNTRGGM